MLEAYLPLRWTDVVDLAVVAAAIWAVLVWLRRARSRWALLGVAILGGLYLLARQLQLQLTVWLFQGFFAVLVIVLVVVFQEDLRRLFEQIAVWGLRRRSPTPPTDVADTLARTVAHLVARRTGALIVIPGRQPLERHVEGGIRLGGRLSEPLLLSLFDTGSPGHDGAVLVSGDRVDSFAAHLPLSTNQAEIGPGGTRHASALGLAERTDALCIVVSEERGTVSIAHSGHLRLLAYPSQLPREIRRFVESVAPAPGVNSTAWRRFARQWREVLVAVGLAALLWFSLVPGSGMVEVVRTAPVVIENLPAGYVLEEVDPPEVELTLSGRRWDLFFARGALPRVRIDALLVKLGRRTFQLTPEQIELPAGVDVRDVTPSSVKISVRQGNDTASASP